MKPNLLMICFLLRSNAAAFATHPASVAGRVIVVVGRGSGGSSVSVGRRAAGSTSSSALGLFVRGGGKRSAASSSAVATNPTTFTSSSSSSLHDDKASAIISRSCEAASTSTSTRMHRRQSSSFNNDVYHDDVSATASSSAAATTTSTTPLATLPPASIIEKGGGYIAFRLARRTDVEQIQNCNLATLPENYNANFYVNHMRAWPELTLVAEHIPDGYDITREEEGGGGGGGAMDRSEKITPLSDYIRGRRQRFDDAGSSASSRPQKEIIGYILGKIEERPIKPPPRQIFPPSKVVPLYNTDDYYCDDDDHHDEETLLRYLKGSRRQPSRPQQRLPPPSPPPPPPLTEKIGHVTSLAVHSHARRLGIATTLLSQLHYHLVECHGAQSVGLHVRISNKAAVRLYCEEGYDVADIIPFYYGDGEDAYFMRKDLNRNAIVEKSDVVSKSERPIQQQQHQQQQRRGEKERNEWLNRDAIRNGSFFEGRKNMRELEEQRANTLGSMTGSSSSSNISSSGRSSRNNNLNAPPSIPGQFRRSFHALMQHQHRDGFNISSSPPWEVGPEGLRLPRYRKVAVRAESHPTDVVSVRKEDNMNR